MPEARECSYNIECSTCSWIVSAAIQDGWETISFSNIRLFVRSQELSLACYLLACHSNNIYSESIQVR